MKRLITIVAKISRLFRPIPLLIVSILNIADLNVMNIYAGVFNVGGHSAMSPLRDHDNLNN